MLKPNTQNSSTILLTPHQKKIFDYIRDFVEKNHYSPSFREIQSHFSFSSLSSVHKHLKTLEKKGIITYQKGERRSISIAQEKKSEPEALPSLDYILLPIIAELIVGQPLHLFSRVQAKLPVPRSVLLHPQEAHILQLTGTSLLPFQLCNQDFLIIEPRKDIHENDLLLVRDKLGKYMIKRFNAEKESSYGDPLFLHEEDIKYGSYLVMATVVFVLRNCSLS